VHQRFSAMAGLRGIFTYVDDVVGLNIRAAEAPSLCFRQSFQRRQWRANHTQPGMELLRRSKACRYRRTTVRSVRAMCAIHKPIRRLRCANWVTRRSGVSRMACAKRSNGIENLSRKRRRPTGFNPGFNPGFKSYWGTVTLACPDTSFLFSVDSDLYGVARPDPRFPEVSRRAGRCYSYRVRLRKTLP